MQFQINPSNGLSAVVQRVKLHISTTLTDSQCVQLALASSIRNRQSMEDVVGVLVPHFLLKRVIENKDLIKLTPVEWKSIFHSTVSPVRDVEIGRFASLEAFQAQSSKLDEAFKITLQEHDQSIMWKKPWHKTIVYIAAHMEYAEEALNSSLGTIIRADQRRIDELLNSIDDAGTETLVFTGAIEVVSNLLCL